MQKHLDFINKHYKGIYMTVEDFADYAAAFGRGVCSIVYRTEYHLVTTS